MGFNGVEIDIRMRQNVEAESKKAKKGIGDLNQASKKMQDELKEVIAIQKQVLRQLRSDIAGLEKDYNKVKFSTNPNVIKEKNKLSAAINHLRSELKLEEKGLKTLEKEQQAYINKTKNIETELRNVRNEMIALKMQGRENTQEYKVLEERLGILGTAYRELSTTQKALTTGGTQMSGVLSALNGVSGAFTATAGAMGLVNGNSEDMQKMQTRLQSMMAITIGLQEVSNALHKTSAFRITTVTKVKELWAIANTKVATTLGITNIQAQILMGTLTLGLSVAITAIVIAIDRYVNKQKEAAERTKKFNESVADSASGIMASYSKMQKEWEALGSNLKDKEKYINDNKKAFDNLGVSINGINDADSLFVKNTEAFKTAVLERAKAAAYMEQAKEEYKKIIPLELEEDKRRTALDIRGQTALQEQISKKLQSIEKMVELSVESTKKANQKLKEAGINSDEVKNATKLFWENQKKAAQTALESMKDTQKGTEAWNEQMRRYNQATAKLETWNFSPKTNKNSENKQKKAEKRLKSLTLDVENEIASSVLATMKKGKEQRLVQIDNEHQQRLLKIKKYREETKQLEAEIGKKAPGTHSQINKYEATENKRYQKERKAVKEAYKLQAKKEFDELVKKYATYEQQKTEILKKFAEERKKLEEKNEGGKYTQNIIELNKREANVLFELQKSAKGTKSIVADVFSDLSNKSIAEMQKILQNARALFEFLKAGKFVTNNAFGLTESEFKSLSSPENLKALGDSITKTDELIKKSDKSLKGLTKDVKELFGGKLNSQQFEATFTRVQSKLQSATQLVGMFADSLRSIGELTGSGGLSDVADFLGGVTSAVSSAMSGASAGMAFGPVGAAIGGALGLLSGGLSKSAEIEKKHRESLLRIRLTEIQQQDTYNQLLFKQKMLMEDADNLFGISALSKALGYIELYKQSFSELQEKITKTEKEVTYKVFGKEIKIGFKTLTSELDSIMLKTGSRTSGWGFWKKQRDIYSSITSVYPDLIDKEGKLNILRAKAIVQSKELGQEDKLRLQNIINLYEQTEEAQKQLENYIKDTFGELGSGLMDSIINSLKTGEDAFENFAKSVGNVMGKLGRQLIQELYLSEAFTELQKKIKNTLTDGQAKGLSKEQILKNVRSLIAGFSQTMKEQMPLIQETARAWQKETKEATGVDIWSNENATRTGASKGIAQASQDSIDDVLGRLYTLVRFVNEIRTNEQLAQITNTQALNIRTEMLSQLTIIAENTAYNKHLKELANDIEEIKQYGIKLKASQ